MPEVMTLEDLFFFFFFFFGWTCRWWLPSPAAERNVLEHKTHVEEDTLAHGGDEGEEEEGLGVAAGEDGLTGTG